MTEAQQREVQQREADYLASLNNFRLMREYVRQLRSAYTSDFYQDSSAWKDWGRAGWLRRELQRRGLRHAAHYLAVSEAHRDDGLYAEKFWPLIRADHNAAMKVWMCCWSEEYSKAFAEFTKRERRNLIARMQRWADKAVDERNMPHGPLFGEVEQDNHKPEVTA